MGVRVLHIYLETEWGGWNRYLSKIITWPFTQIYELTNLGATSAQIVKYKVKKKDPFTKSPPPTLLYKRVNLAGMPL